MLMVGFLTVVVPAGAEELRLGQLWSGSLTSHPLEALVDERTGRTFVSDAFAGGVVATDGLGQGHGSFVITSAAPVNLVLSETRRELVAYAPGSATMTVIEIDRGVEIARVELPDVGGLGWSFDERVLSSGRIALDETNQRVFVVGKAPCGTDPPQFCSRIGVVDLASRRLLRFTNTYADFVSSIRAFPYGIAYDPLRDLVYSLIADPSGTRWTPIDAPGPEPRPVLNWESDGTSALGDRFFSGPCSIAFDRTSQRLLVGQPSVLTAFQLSGPRDGLVSRRIDVVRPLRQPQIGYRGGLRGACSIAIDEPQRIAYVSFQSLGGFAAIDMDTLAILAEVDEGIEPWAIAVDRVRGLVVVTYRDAGLVRVYRAIQRS
jgi:hypothetical protein